MVLGYSLPFKFYLIMKQDTIKLGISINNYTYDEIGQCLYFDGTAIESGTWFGISGPLFFPSEVLIKGAHLFNDVPLVCEHRGLEIGRINKVEPTKLGFRVTDGVVTHRESIDAILSGEKLGLSIEGVFTFDEVRLIAEEIVEALNISLVSNPACKVCGIEHIYIDNSNKGNIAMSEEVIEEGTPVAEEDQVIDTDSVIMSSKDIGASSASEITDDIIEDTPVGEIIEDTSIDSVNVESEPVIEEVSIVTEATPPVEAAVALSEAEPEITPTAGVPSADNYAELADLKVALSSATTTLDTVTAQLASASTKIKTLEDTLASTKVELSTKTAENVVYKNTIDELQTKIKAIEETERNNIIADIQRIDSDVDMNLIGSMSTVQLSAYKSTLDRFATKGMFGEKKSVKVDEPVKLSANDEVVVSFDRHDVAVGIVPYLRSQQKHKTF